MKLIRRMRLLRALERYVAKANRRDVTARLNEFHKCETSKLDSALAAMQSASIARELCD